jgi:2-keto-4-pentenoate hydratase
MSGTGEGRVMSAAWDDPRVSRGMTTQLSSRRERIRAGEQPLGWKLAFGAPAAMERLATKAPLVGFLMERALLTSGASLSLAGWKKPAAEPEIAVHLGKELPGGADRDTAKAAIAGLGPAIEIADVECPPEEVERVLAGDIYQRNLVLGSMDASRAGGALDGLSCRVAKNGIELANPSHLQELTGELIDNVRYVADLLAAFGEALLAGQIIIAGSILPPIWVEAGEEIVFQLQPIDTISIRFAAKSGA